MSAKGTHAFGLCVGFALGETCFFQDKKGKNQHFFGLEGGELFLEVFFHPFCLL